MATAFPSPETLATLVSNVTGTMLGITFAPDPESRDEPVWRTAALPIPAADQHTVRLRARNLGLQLWISEGLLAQS